MVKGGCVMELNIHAMNDYENWKKTLHTAVNTGKDLGMEDHTITSIATVVGDFFYPIMLTLTAESIVS